MGWRRWSKLILFFFIFFIFRQVRVRLTWIFFSLSQPPALVPSLLHRSTWQWRPRLVTFLPLQLPRLPLLIGPLPSIQTWASYSGIIFLQYHHHHHLLQPSLHSLCCICGAALQYLLVNHCISHICRDGGNKWQTLYGMSSKGCIFKNYLLIKY